MQYPFNAFTQGMPLPDIFSYGQLFAFSGLAGKNLHEQDWCGVLTEVPGEILFSSGRDCPCRTLLRFTENELIYDAVLSDLIAAQEGKVLVTFADAETIVGRSDCVPSIRLETEDCIPGDRTVQDGQYALSLCTAPLEDGRTAFAFCRRKNAETARQAARESLGADVDTLAKAVMDWYGDCILCPDMRYAKLWYKCMSVNRVNVFSPQEGFDRFFTTPDRLPHRDIWVWDSSFHALAMVHYAPAIAEDAILCVLDCQREDGFIPHRIKSRTETSDITHPPVLCAAVWNIYEVTGDLSLLERTVEKLRKYLQWDLDNRRSPSGLMTWATRNDDANCRCDESGMNNSPRFDTAEPLEAVDFSVFMSYEMLCMRRIYIELGDQLNAMYMEQMQKEMIERINARLWDQETGCYFDRTWDGEFRRILTPVSFLPLFAFICDPRQARRLVMHLQPLMELPLPIPSAVDETGGAFTRDMWRGGVWLNYNYFVYLGLQRYGFGKLASDLRRKTLEGVFKQYCETGNIFEFYDPFGGNPMQLDRKGPKQNAQTHWHSITDFNWSACFIELFLCS